MGKPSKEAIEAAIDRYLNRGPDETGYEGMRVALTAASAIDGDFNAGVEAMKSLLVEYTGFNGEEEFIPSIKPGHGPCCTCQTCGRPYDECVCEHNEIVAKIAEIRKLKR